MNTFYDFKLLNNDSKANGSFIINVRSRHVQPITLTLCLTSSFIVICCQHGYQELRNSTLHRARVGARTLHQ